MVTSYKFVKDNVQGLNAIVMLGCLIFCILTPGVSSSQSQRSWGTFYGGTGDDLGGYTATDASGNVYLAGYTNSPGLAPGGFQDHVNGKDDIYLVKFDSSGNRVWATYYGGTGDERVQSVSVDIYGNVYVTGTTDGADGIAYNGFQNTFGSGIETFLVKFSPGGSRIWGTYYGGAGGELSSVTTDAGGNVYLGGMTASTTHIAFQGFQNTFNSSGPYNPFLVKFDSAGHRIWGTYYGVGAAYNSCVATDASGNVYLTGKIGPAVPSMAYKGFQDTLLGPFDAFLVKFNSRGERLWATFYGGPGIDVGTSVATDIAGNVYLTGETTSDSFIAFHGFKDTLTHNIQNVFLVKFDSLGNRIWATYYNGGDDGPIAVTDKCGNVYIEGTTYNLTGVAFNGFQDTLGGYLNTNRIGAESYYLATFDADGNLKCATYYGGGHQEDGSVATDVFGNVYLAGTVFIPSGSLSAFVSGNGYQTTPGGGSFDCFLAKFPSCAKNSASVAGITISASSGNICPGDPVTFIATSTNGGVNPSYQWKVNGINTGNNKAAFNDSTLKNGDAITCVVTPNAMCVSSTPVMSDTIRIAVVTVTAGTISAIHDTICSGTIEHLLVSDYSGTIQWQSSSSSKNFTNISGASSSTYKSAPLTQTTFYRVVAQNANCADTSAVFAVTVIPEPQAAFTSVVNGQDVTFNSGGSIGGTSYYWDFGDGVSSAEQNPVHTYDSVKQYHVCLTLKNNFNCDFTLCENITVYPTGVNNINDIAEWFIFPNPTSGTFYLNLGNTNLNSKTIEVEVKNELGQVIKKDVIKIKETNTTELFKMPNGVTSGIYFVRVFVAGNIYTKKLMIEKE